MRETCRRWLGYALLCWALMPLPGWALAPLHFVRAELLETPSHGYTPPPGPKWSCRMRPSVRSCLQHRQTTIHSHAP